DLLGHGRGRDERHRDRDTCRNASSWPHLGLPFATRDCSRRYGGCEAENRSDPGTNLATWRQRPGFVAERDSVGYSPRLTRWRSWTGSFAGRAGGPPDPGASTKSGPRHSPNAGVEAGFRDNPSLKRRVGWSGRVTTSSRDDVFSMSGTPPAIT